MLSRSAVRSCLTLCFAIALSAAVRPAAAADPILMFVLGFAKNIIESNMEANAQRPAPVSVLPLAPPAPAPVALKAPASMNSDDLKALVDDSFAYLSRQQRAELLAGLEKTLADPALAAERSAILGEFVNVARQVGFTHRQLDRLSGSEKRAVVGQFATNYRSLPAEQQQALMQQLRQGALPLPPDLNDMMLTALTTAR